ncbi:hypothetical protein PLESTB_001973500 [Pleodorina starrii]|uniref:site-specific DNA-methyltransferase (adenine-specific) n=2 Tax=cellular organisms TaxID=131567 RepID=A0A9W6FCJ6_9CHLO|nr:hypothetical protein PLESTB_001973500 [Pleodorina starrii]
MAARLDILERLVSSPAFRSEATIQSDVRMFLLDPELGLAEEQLEVELEAQVGQRRRIDIEVGCTVIEVKKSLDSQSVMAAATEQLADYVLTRTREVGARYVGVLTDGRQWIAFHEVDGVLREATRHAATVGTAGAAALLSWLEGVLATRTGVRPTPKEIAQRLGAGSSSHALDFATLQSLYRDSKHLPTVQLKRQLWSKLLHSALGTQFTDDDELFLEHTLLVNSAEIIAHLLLGVDATQLPPASLLSGSQFAQAGLYGVVDRDFFDWVLEVPGGEGFVTSLARRLARFDWSAVEHDVLKVLYESVIPATTRKALGEYYTPDWLAYEVVQEAVTDPLTQRVLDPSCGSGSFLFYAVRRYLSAAEEAGMSLTEAMHQVSSKVMGIDLHPVAVALARVTYLLALGRDRLNAPDRGELSVPVYLGDSIGWDQHEDLLSVGHLVIQTDEGDQLFPTELRFPDHLLDDAARFDELVETLVTESGRAADTRTNKLSEGTLRRLAIGAGDVAALNENFMRLKQLHEAGRNHIWSYYIRNVSRPTWLARDDNQVDVLVGNPPWLSYRHMSKDMQAIFKRLSKARYFWHNESTATHQDLAGLFIARTVERFLTGDGSFAFVVPNAVIDRDYWAGFRNGEFLDVNVAFTPSWDLRRIRPHLFPRGSAVVFGHRSRWATTMPSQILRWEGRAPAPHALAGEPLETLTRTPGTVSITSEADRSVYAPRFANGATLYPRALFRVEPNATSVLGVPHGRRAVRSQRSSTEKAPWVNIPPLTGIVESEFIWPAILGEHIAPFRILGADEFVLPMTTRGNVLDPSEPQIDRWSGLADWMRRADDLWREHQNGPMTLLQRIDHMRTLRQQTPIPPLRVVYSKSGMHLCAAVLTDQRVVIDHTLYWAAVSSRSEANYLVGILNSPSLTELVRPLMSYGKDERHIDKSVWKLPIPQFNIDDDQHLLIASLAEDLTQEIAQLEFASKYFVTIRKNIRAYLAKSTQGQKLDEAVQGLMG